MATQNPIPTQLSILRVSQVAQTVGCSVSHVWRMAQQPEKYAFPKPVKLTPMTTGWVAQEVEQWLRQRIAARDGLANAIERQQEANG